MPATWATITVPASLRSDHDRLRVGIMDRLQFGITDRLRRNPHTVRRGLLGSSTNSTSAPSWSSAKSICAAPSPMDCERFLGRRVLTPDRFVGSIVAVPLCLFLMPESFRPAALPLSSPEAGLLGLLICVAMVSPLEPRAMCLATAAPSRSAPEAALFCPGTIRGLRL
jgi:hypothetical protein